MPNNIRLATPEDAPQILAIYSPYCDTPTSFEIIAPSVEEMRQRIERVSVQYPWLVCAEDEKITGYVYASAHRERAAYRWSVDTTVYIQRDRQRQGLGRALYSVLFSMLELQGYVNAYAGITLPNPGSVRLHEALGFEPIGVYRHVGYKCGAWHDVAWYQMLLRTLPSEPDEPKSLAKVDCNRMFETLRLG